MSYTISNDNPSRRIRGTTTLTSRVQREHGSWILDTVSNDFPSLSQVYLPTHHEAAEEGVRRRFFDVGRTSHSRGGSWLGMVVRRISTHRVCRALPRRISAVCTVWTRPVLRFHWGLRVLHGGVDRWLSPRFRLWPRVTMFPCWTSFKRVSLPLFFFTFHFYPGSAYPYVLRIFVPRHAWWQVADCPYHPCRQYDGGDKTFF